MIGYGELTFCNLGQCIHSIFFFSSLMMHMVVIIFQGVFSIILSLGGLGNLGLRKIV